jgi:predicted nucleic acid-binding protein
MESEMVYENISLDTSFIIRQNFLAGSAIRSLYSLCKDGSAKLFLTDIVYRETIAEFRKKTLQTIEDIKKPRGILVNKAQLLRNFSEMEIFFNLPALNCDDLCLKFHLDFDKWLKKTKVTMISTDSISIKKVIDNYFDNRPPFKDGPKKHEFPDAFTITALEDYFSERAEKVYILTDDKGILSVESDYLIPIKDYSSLFDKVIRATKVKRETKAIQLIEEEFKVSQFKIKRNLIYLINQVIEEEIDSKTSIYNYDIDSLLDITLSEIEIGNYSIVSLNIKDGIAKLECNIEFSYDITVAVTDMSSAVYDREDDEWYGIESKDIDIKDKCEVPIIIQASIDIKEGYIELEVEGINNGQYLGIIKRDENY